MYSDGVGLVSSGGKRARRQSDEETFDDLLALDAVDSNPHPTSRLILSHSSLGGARAPDSPKSSAALFLSSRANSSPPAFRDETPAMITETNHFYLDANTIEKVSIPVPVDEFRDEPAAITETNHFLDMNTIQKVSMPSDEPCPSQRAASRHRDGLVRTLLTELREERSARLALQEELSRVKKQLMRERGGPSDRQAGHDEHNTRRSGTTPRLPSISAQPTPFRAIPIVDLSLPLADVAFDIGRACRHVGFFYVINHGVEGSLISDAMSFSKRFFDLPADVKAEVDSKESRSGARGYFALGGEDLNAKDGTRDLVAEGQALGRDVSSKLFRGDWKEGFDCGRDISPSDEEYGLSAMVDCNNWPREEVLPRFRDAMLAYQRSLLELGAKLMKAFAVGLGLPQDYFLARIQKPMATLRLLHYPPQPKRDLVDLDRIGCGAHTDYGLCTLLLQDNVGGLQVRNAADEWIEAPPIPSSFVVNLGDMMSRWTNGRYASTVHRVVNLSGRERYSVPFFINPDVGTVVDCLPTCQNEREPPRYAPEESHKILSKRYRGSFVHMKPGN